MAKPGDSGSGSRSAGRIARQRSVSHAVQCEFSKLLAVVERQSPGRSPVSLSPDDVTRAAISAIVRREGELIRMALRKLRKDRAWVRRQWSGVGRLVVGDSLTAEQYADAIRWQDRTVPPPGVWRTRLLEAGRKLSR